MNKDLELSKNAIDLTQDEKASLDEYISNGLQGLSRIGEDDIIQWFELYMSGRSYKEIATSTYKNKNAVLYIAQRNGWHEKKMNHLNDVATNFVTKTKQAKLEGANTVLLANMALGKYISEELQEFIKTGDKKIMERFDGKNFQNFLKAIESLDKILGRSNKSDTPSIDINISGGSTKTESSSEGIEITTKTTNGDTLSLLAKYKRDQNS